LASKFLSDNFLVVKILLICQEKKRKKKKKGKKITGVPVNDCSSKLLSTPEPENVL